MMAEILVTSNATTVAAEIEGMATVVVARAAAVTRLFGSRLVSLVKENAEAVFRHDTRSDYRGHIRGDYRADGAQIMASAYSDHPGAGRDEFGMHGTDALGRHISQPPRPHFRSALAELEGPYTDAIAATFDGV